MQISKKINLLSSTKVSSPLGSSVNRCAGSSPVPAPYRVFITNLRVGCGHSISFCLFVPLCMYEQESSCSFLLCRLCVRNIFHGDALAGFFSVVAPAPKARQLQMPYKLIVYLYHLFAVFACHGHFVHIYTVNEFPQQRCSQLIHLHKFPNSGNEFLFSKLHFIHFRQAFTVCGDFLFQFQPFRLVLARKTHKHLVAQLARYIVLIALNAQLRYLLTANNTLLQLTLNVFFLFENICIGFIGKQHSKAFFVIAQAFG